MSSKPGLRGRQERIDELIAWLNGMDAKQRKRILVDEPTKITSEAVRRFRLSPRRGREYAHTITLIMIGK